MADRNAHTSKEETPLKSCNFMTSETVGWVITDEGKAWLQRIEAYKSLPWWKRLFTKNPLYEA
jgi:hypothetical protein